MAPPIRTPRSTWVEEGLRALARGGPDAVRVEALAKALGVTKGGFYGHFADREELLAAMLDAWEQASVGDVVRAVDAEGGAPQEHLMRLFELAAGAQDLLAIDLAVRDWSRRDPAVADRLRRVDNRRMAYLRSLFSGVTADPREVEARSLLVASLWIGGHFFGADHDGRDRAAVARDAMRLLLR